MVIAITPIISNRPKLNKCKHCQIAKLCLPASLPLNQLKHNHKLQFTSRILKPGEHLFRQNESTQKLYVIRSGILKSYHSKLGGSHHIMGFYMPPDLFGWDTINPSPFSVNVVALDYSNICEIPLSQLPKLFQEIPQFEKQLANMIQHQMEQANLGQLRTTTQQRVADFLLQLSQRYAKLDQNPLIVKLPMTYQDIANYLRIAPETLSRAFAELQKNALIKIERKKVHLMDIERLRIVAEYITTN